MADHLASNAPTWQRDTWTPISLEPARPRVEALYAQLLADVQQATHEFGIDRALETARTGGRR